MEISMSDLRESIVKASIAHFEGQIEKHKINVEVLLNNQVGVAEHPDVMETIEKELGFIAEYHDKLEVLSKYFQS